MFRPAALLHAIVLLLALAVLPSCGITDSIADPSPPLSIGTMPAPTTILPSLPGLSNSAITPISAPPIAVSTIIPAGGDWLIVGPFDGTPQLANLRTGAASALGQGQTRAAAISPDGARLAFFRRRAGEACCQLELYDLTHTPPAALIVPIPIDEPLVVGAENAIRWSPDSRRFLVLSGHQSYGATTARAFGRDGAALGQVVLAEWERLLEAPRLVRDDEVVLVQRDEERTVLHAVRFGAGNSVPLPEVTLMDRPPYSMGWLLAYVPVS